MVSSRFLTLKKSDPQFTEMLWGGNDTQVMPLPMQSMNIGKSDETVTFELKPNSEIQKPGFFQVFSSTVKLRQFTLILFPLFYVLVKNYVSGSLHDPFSLSFAALAMMMLFSGLNIRNDISDHFSGFDRVNIPTQEKPIRSGWATAKTLSTWSWIFIGLGILLSIPVLILQAEERKVAGVAAVLIFLGQFLQRNSYKEKKFGETILFLLMGVGISAGFQVAAGAGIDTQIISFGIFWGACVLFLIHTNNFGHLLTSTQAGIRNTVTKLGFDKAKIFLAMWWVGCLVLWTALHVFYSIPMWTVVATVLLVLISVPLFKSLNQVQSPVGSGLTSIRRKAYATFLVMVFIFLVENLWFLGTRSP